MCTRIRAGLTTRLVCVLLFLSGFLLSGTCQNAEPRRSFGTRSAARDLELRQDDMLRDESDRQFDWDASPEGEKQLDENRRSLSARGGQAEAKTSETEAEVAPRADGNRNTALLPPKGAAKSSTSSSSSAPASSTLRRGLNVTSAASGSRRRGSGGERGGRDKRRRAKESSARNSSGSMDFYERPRDGGGGENVRENEIRGKRGQQQAVDKRGVATSTKKAKDPRGRKFRAERRRRRKNRERKRGRKRARVGEDKTTSTKFKRKMNDAPAALFLGRTDGERSEDARYLAENASGIKDGSRGDSVDEVAANVDSRVERDRVTFTTTESGWLRPKVTPRRSTENVERELSKKLEQEITRSGIDDYSSLEDRILGTSIAQKQESRSEPLSKETKSTSNEVSGSRDDRARFGNSRYDAEKMLGYSRTPEDLPILDLENEVLARTIKDYNAYMTNSLKLSAVKRHNEDSERRKGSVHHGQPFRDGDENWRESGKTSPTTLTSEEDDKTRGDLSCINGTFLPAPLARHALIKYVKSSIPGHEYLEADYECTPGYYMASTSSRLLCRDRQWVGQVPKCKVKQSGDSACAEAPCEHVCKEVAGGAVCSCYTGFRLDGYKCIDVNECEENNGGCEHRCINMPGSFRCECPKGMKQGEDRFTCMDINECLLNNGHGPCQDTCRNLVGGYECSCEGLQDTVLSPDNHTCQDAGPCSVNNAGCSHTCLSTMGRVFCLCPDGFMLEDDWKTCQDVDECAVPDLQTEVCRYGCINTPGSYRCAEPMELKDQPILDTLSITCLPGYEATPDNTCIDINECEVDNGGCTEVCENTDGSFFCACDGDEKALSSDGKSCLDINNVACPPLNPAGRGYLMCSRLATPKPWRGRRRATNRPGTKCYLKCPHGYQLHGEYELACRSDGTWDGPKHGECVRYSKPRLECPKDVVAEVPPGHDEAFVTFDQPATDLDWFRYVRSKPSWGTRLEANLKPGTHEIAFFARHPVSKKQASCVLRIIVKGGEAPKVKDCPRDIEVTGKNGTTITWTEPIFTDNVKVTRIRSNENPGRPFDIGGHKIEYEASDEAGWSSKCVFTVVLRQE